MCVPGTVETVRERIESGEPEPPAPRLSRRAALAAGAGTVLAAAVPGTAMAKKGRGRGHGHGHGRGKGRERLTDLTHVLSEDFPRFPGAPETSRQTTTTIPANGFYGQTWTLWEHTGTHIDAPAHFVPAPARTSEELRLEELVAPLVVIDISDRAASDNDTFVTPDDLMRYERRQGRIPRGAVVAMDSGWAARSGSAASYQNGMHFPGFGVEAVRWLLANRRIGGIGVDTLSLDPGQSSTFDTHKTLLGADRFGIENLRNLGEVPPRGATVVVGLVPWREGSGGPARVFASH